MSFLRLAFLSISPGWQSAKVHFPCFPRGLDWLYNSRFSRRHHEKHALNFTVATLDLVAFQGWSALAALAALQPFLRFANG